ncbi:hypothetical protein FGSG_09236 [Fusarium graminearum PH-1]|uniref:Uncharacterized protein n=1 Tax=Gibberella zeae (strain ATCC MYA-4620 / CBS 123657 / FGSC 9075 / NRRL 31084 / PH-1) TaxID=229533 RepID=I1RY08_GIBZE|nr:hypothetical protein FGSG_09236 [Fusarium graminearum PH-1]ESU15777.1 hypothetical protein FGSG_09236 [Fusarium graminearum PH-1]|eukprot:XP_011328539.1 hypothetical protein FGSG_09236 [Fusarium graminearum PH-1]
MKIPMIVLGLGNQAAGRIQTVSIQRDRVSGPEESDDTSQGLDSSTQHLNRHSIQDSNTRYQTKFTFVPQRESGKGAIMLAPTIRSPPKTPRGSEPPKKVCKPGILSVVGHLALFHLPPVVVTLALVVLYSVRIYWGKLSDEQLSYLQFAAKGHETLILVSLADILMHRIRYTLLQDKGGVPLGFLSSSFIIGSPISYLFSLELWAPLLRPVTKAKRTSIYIQLTGILIVISIILSAAVAPLSAIAIIPRSGLWRIPVPMEEKGFFIYSYRPLWKTDLSQSIYYHNEGDNLDEALLQLRSTMAELAQRQPPSYTWRISNSSFIARERTISITANPIKEHPLAIATTPMKILRDSPEVVWEDMPVDILTRIQQKLPGDRFESEWDLPGANFTVAEKWKRLRQAPTSRWKQPIVAVECAYGTETETNTPTFMFNSNITNNKVTLDLAQEKEKNDPYSKFLFLELPDSRTSPAILFLHSQKTLELCRIFSRWIETDTWLEHGESVYRTHLDAPLSDVQVHFGQSTDLIKIGKDWLNSTSRNINDLPREESSSPENSSYQSIMDFCDTVGTKDCYPVSLAAFMAYVLSWSDDRAGYNILQPFQLGVNESPRQGDVIINKECFVSGYGYDWKSSRTIPLAFSVLLLHVLIVFIHMTIVLWSRHPWHSSSWGSFGQMMVLALRSKALDGLGSVGAGVSSSKTWSTSVSVRVVGDEDRLEMAIQNEKGGHSQYQEVSGEVEEEGVDRGPSLAQPGIKYH